MKKIGLLLLAAVAAAGFVSCDDTETDQAGSISFVTVHTSWLGNDDYYFETDTGATIYPSDKSRVGSYEAKEGARALITFNWLESQVPGYDYNVALYGIATIYSSPARVVTDEAELEVLKDDDAQYRGGRLLGNWVTMIVRHTASDISVHQFSLIVNKVGESTETDEEYLDMELRHDSNGDAQWQIYDTYVSFDMLDLEDLLAGKKGIRVRFKNGTETDTFEIDRATDGAQQTL